MRRIEVEVAARVLDALLLPDTVLYPGGGGQPPDAGTVCGLPVVELERRPEGVLHRLAAPLDARRATVELDWPRRYDHMQQHTAQHLLSAIAADRFGWATLAFHLGEEYSAVELDTPSLSPDQLDDLSCAVNAEVRAAHPVRMRLVAPGELSALPVRTRGLPEGHQGPVRLIEIEGLDLNTCGGIHVGGTAELQQVQLTATEKIRGRVRLHYLAGDRVERALSAALAHQQALTAALRCGPAEHLAQLERLRDQARETGRQARALCGELAALLAERLAEQPGPAAGLHRPDADLPFLQNLAAAFEARRPEALLLLSGDGVFLLCGPEERVAAAAPLVLETLEARGGGRGGRLQGKAGRPEAVEQALARLVEDAEPQ